MKTHDLAKQLQEAAASLLLLPDLELSELSGSINLTKKKSKRQLSDSTVFDQLDAILSLTKPQLLEVVHQFNLPIEIRARDAARDVLGRLVVYFRQNPDKLATIRTKAVHGTINANPDLMSALDILLGRNR